MLTQTLEEMDDGCSFGWKSLLSISGSWQIGPGSIGAVSWGDRSLPSVQHFEVGAHFDFVLSQRASSLWYQNRTFSYLCTFLLPACSWSRRSISWPSWRLHRCSTAGCHVLIHNHRSLPEWTGQTCHRIHQISLYRTLDVSLLYPESRRSWKQNSWS